MTSMDNDFYEDDEPIEDIRAAFANGVKGCTSAPLPAGAEYIVPRPTFGFGSAIVETPSFLGMSVSAPAVPLPA